MSPVLERGTVRPQKTQAVTETSDSQSDVLLLLTDNMWPREELLKSIWHAFTALDVDQRGKVSKSQLKVRLRTVLLCSVTTSCPAETWFLNLEQRI